MSSNLVIITQSPYQGRRSHESLEAIMSMALFDIDHKVIFFEDGLYWLTQNQKVADQKSLEKQLTALPMYGSEELYFVSEHQIKLLPNSQLHSSVSSINLPTLTEWFRKANHVEVI